MALTPSAVENARIYVVPTTNNSGITRGVLYAQVGSELWTFDGIPADAGATTQPNGTIVLVTVAGVGRLGVAYGGRRWAHSKGTEGFALTWSPPLNRPHQAGQYPEVRQYPEVPGSLWAYRLRNALGTVAVLIALTTSQAVVGQAITRYAYLGSRVHLGSQVQ